MGFIFEFLKIVIRWVYNMGWRYIHMLWCIKKMTREQIKSIIDKELSEVKDLTNVHGLDLTDCLIEPLKEKYKSSTDETITLELWTVLEESKDRTGYKITFDDSDNTFGLGIMTDKDELMEIGIYGTFLDTLKGM